MVIAVSGDELFGGGFVSAKAFGAVGDGTTDDTSDLQDAIDYCFGSAVSPNGMSYYFNKKLYFPPGHYKITSPLILTKLVGAVIQGSGRFTTTIENVMSGSGAGDVFRTNGMGYSSISDMQLVCHEDGICLDLDDDGEGGGAALQANSIENIFCLGSYESSTIGIRVGESGFMGSECIFKMVHYQGCMLTGLLVNNFNALQHQVYGGQAQACGIGIWATVGSVPVISGVGFQQQVDCDIRTSGGAHNAMSVIGCRTESTNFIINDGGQILDVSACLQTTAEPGYFVSSPGRTSIRSCEANGSVHPWGPCNLILENADVGFEIDASELWWIPNNDSAANLFIRNCFLTQDSVRYFVPEQRRYTEDGMDILAAIYLPGTYGPIVIGGAPVVVYNVSLAAGTIDAAWNGVTAVNTIDAAQLDAASGTQIRVSLFFRALAAGNSISGYVGQRGAGDIYDFTGTQAQLLWSASPTLNGNGSADQVYVSDWITLGEAYNNTKTYNIALNIGAAGASVDTRFVNQSSSNATHYLNASADAATTNKTGYTNYVVGGSAQSAFLTKLEIR